MVVIVIAVVVGFVVGLLVGGWLVDLVRKHSSKPGFEFPDRPTVPELEATTCEEATRAVQLIEDAIRRVRAKLSVIDRALGNLAVQIGGLTAAALAAWTTAALVASTPIFGPVLAGTFVAAATAATRLLLDSIARRTELSRDRDRLNSQLPQAEAQLEEAIAVRDQACASPGLAPEAPVT